jgi:GAF domain-containing protein
MTAIPDKTAADPQEIIAELKRKLDERTSERDEALERQTATADILQVIARLPSDVQPVFEAIAERSNRLVGGHSTAVYRFLNETAELVAFTRVSPEGDEVLRRSFPRPLADHPLFQLVRGGDVIQVRDTESDLRVKTGVQSIARARGFRSLLLIPLASADGPIGLITVTRKEIGTFADHHVQLLRTFADQAVIAISNVKLFQEVQERTRDLSESLQQQTATAEVLKVISSSPGELEPVFQALLENAVHLCEAEFAMLFLYEENEFREVELTARV